MPTLWISHLAGPWLAAALPFGALCALVLIFGRRNRQLQRALRLFDAERKTMRALDQALEQQIDERSRQLAAKNTQLEESLQALQETQRQLVHSEKMASLGVLSAGVAHEINNPLAFIMANLNYVREMLGLNRPSVPEQPFRSYSVDERRDLKAALDESLEGGRRIASIVSDLKTFSRSDAVKLAPVDVTESLSAALRMAEKQLVHRARVVKQFDPVGPVVADSNKLSQVFLNLLMNAGQAIPEGQPQEHEITLKIYEGARGAVIEVKDTGSGISPEAKQRLFEPFFTTKPLGQGTGLGLSVSQGIIQSFGGAIEVESELGKGSIFRIVLPRAAGGN